MKLLLDNNLSPKLVSQINDLFSDSSHVTFLNLDRASDMEVWNRAKQAGFTLVSKDSDFNELLASKGFPPKIIWIRLGNCTTAEILNALRENYEAILDFSGDHTAGLLEIY
jgi:predicted nuclease of predicted toxin-antitoxin system